MAIWNYCAICGKRIEAGDPCLGVEKKNVETAGDSICFDCVKIENINGLDKTVSITDLLARAEAAEARCETVEKMVKEYQDTIVPGYRERAEKAEREAKEAQQEVTLCRNGWKKAEREMDAAVADLRLVSDCRTCGNVTPWCIENPDKCKGWKWRGKKEE